MDELLEAVIVFTGISRTDIFSRVRTKDVCEARCIFMYLSKTLLGETNTNIALFLSRTEPNICTQLLNFEQSLKVYKGLHRKVDGVNLAVSLGTNLVGIGKLTDIAKQLGSTSEWSAIKIVEMQTELANLGFSIPGIQEATEPILAFATAMNVDLREAANVAGIAIRSFGADASDTEKIAGVLAVAANNSALSFDSFKTILGMVGPVAQQFGVSMEDTVTLVASLANAGFEASSAATLTNTIISNLADSNGKLAASLDKPVQSLGDMVPALLKLRDSGVDVNEVLGVTETRSAAAFDRFLDGADNIAVLRGELSNADGELDRLRKDRLDTVDGSLQQLNNAWEGLMLSFSNSSGVLKFVIDHLTKIVNILNGALLIMNMISGAPARATAAAGDAAVNKVNEMAQTYISQGLSEVKAQEKAINEYSEQTFQKLKEQKEKVDRLGKTIIGNIHSTETKKIQEESTNAREQVKLLEAQYKAVQDLRKSFNKTALDPIIIEDKKDDDSKGKGKSGSGNSKSSDLQKIAEADRKAAQQVELDHLNFLADNQKRIYENERNSLDDRIIALRDYNSIKEEIINTGKGFELDNADLTGNQRLQIEQKANLDIEKNRLDLLDKLSKIEAQEQLKSFKEAAAKTGIASDGNKEAIQKKLLELAKEYDEQVRLNIGNKSKMTEIEKKYASDRMNIIRNGNQKAFEDQMIFLDKQLKLFADNSAIVEEIDKLTTDAQKKNREELFNQEMALLQKTTENRKSAEQQFLEFLNNEYTQAVMSTWQNAMSFANQYYDNQLARIDEEEKRDKEFFDEKLKLIDENLEAGLISEENADAQRRIIEETKAAREKEYEEKRKEIKIKQAKWEKANAIIQTTIATAQAVVKAYSTLGPIAGSIAAAIVGALGAAQIAMIASKEIPAYAQGGKHLSDGLAWVGDGGRSEAVRLPSGEVWKTPSTPTLVYLPKGTEIEPDYKKTLMNLAAYPALAGYNEKSGQSAILMHDEEQRKLIRSTNTQLDKINTNISFIRKNTAYSNNIGKMNNKNKNWN